MTKLDGVNEILIAAGCQRVKALDTDGASPAAEAERFLDSAELDVQAMGWHYNTRENVTLSPAGDSTIAVPSGVITIDGDQKNGETIDITILGDGLYNRDDNTNLFDRDITVAYFLRYEYHCIPHDIQKFINAKAAAEFNFTRFGMKDRQPRLEYKMTELRGLAFRFDEDARDTDVLATTEMLRLRGGRTTGYPAWVNVNGIVTT